MTKTLEQKLCTRSWGYSFVRNIFVRPAFYLFYRKVNIIGGESTPNSGMVIFTPNHQNALMDALSILCTKDRQPVFVARADIFQKPLIVAVLHFLRILPIYRKRDGGNPSDNNRDTFDMILKVMLCGQAVGIMPEGTHNEIKRLRMLQKGVFRLAMQAQEQHRSNPMVKIVPVGIEYTSTRRFRSDVTVRYGTAIDVSNFYEMYLDNPARAFKQMQDKLMEQMKIGMIDIASEHCYHEIETLRRLYLPRALQRLNLNIRNAQHHLSAQQAIIAALQEYERTNPGEMSALCLSVRMYINIIEKQRLSDRLIERQPYAFLPLAGRAILMLAGIPLWIAGIAFNLIPFRLSIIATRKIKDPQFVSSVQFVASLVLFPLYHLIVATLLIAFIPCIWGKIFMPLLIIPLGLFAWSFSLAAGNLIARFRFCLCKLHRDPKTALAIELRKTIFEEIDGITLR